MALSTGDAQPHRGCSTPPCCARPGGTAKRTRTQTYALPCHGRRACACICALTRKKVCIVLSGQPVDVSYTDLFQNRLILVKTNSSKFAPLTNFTKISRARKLVVLQYFILRTAVRLAAAVILCMCSSSRVVPSCMQAAEGARCVALTAPLCRAVEQDAMAAR